jgi:hypothetical protein
MPGSDPERHATVADVVALFASAKTTHSTEEAFTFLFTLAEELSVGYSTNDLVTCYGQVITAAKKSWTTGSYDEEARQAIENLYEKMSESGIGEGFGGGEALEMLAGMTGFAAGKGIPVNAFVMNGLLDEQMDFQQGLMQLLAQEQHLLQQMMQEGKLGVAEGYEMSGIKKISRAEKSKPKSVLSQILAASPVLVEKYHPFLGETIEDIFFFVPSADLVQSLRFVHAPGTRVADLKLVSLVLVDDWAQMGALARLQQALIFLDGDSHRSGPEKTRFSAVYSPPSLAAPNLRALELQIVFDTVSEYVSKFSGGSAEEAALPFLRRVVMQMQATGKIDLTNATKEAPLPDAMAMAVVEAASKISSAVDDDETAGAFVVKELNAVHKGSTHSMHKRVIIANGRCIFIGDDDEAFKAGDYKLLVDEENKYRAKKVERIMRETSFAASLPSSPSSVSGFSAGQPNLVHESDRRSDAVAVASAFLGQYTQSAREDVQEALRYMSTKHSFHAANQSFEEHWSVPTRVVAGDSRYNGGASGIGSTGRDGGVGTVLITVVLDPLTEAAQRVAPLLLVLRDQLRVPLNLLLLPQLEISEFPLQKFYRYVVGADVENAAPSAMFLGLPREHVLTMRMDVPESWNVQSVRALQDVDNLRCSDSACGDAGARGDLTTIEYSLKSLTVAGQCFDVVEKRPPNGLQIALRRVGSQDASNLNQADTLVMQNLGYFQLMANPGIWHVSLAKGRGLELFELLSPTKGPQELSRKGRDEIQGELDKSEWGVSSQQMLVTTFYDVSNQLRVRKRAGKEGLKLLEDIDLGGDLGFAGDDDDDESRVEAEVEARGWGASLGNIFRGGGSGEAPPLDNASLIRGSKERGETVHVFSLATGHLYERFLKIMMLSVHKRCSLPVKFWLFENFLSPTFKDSAHAMAEEYGFGVAFISYKWPSWLRQQTQKQRIIWGYKILFLDVLFPLNVSKVIYVDSDQIVRGDLAELWYMDIKGKPYAYTPFCSSRKETLGYQFWRTGYWKDHLRGRPYHISALSVVDLVAFRRMAVGDQLRALYDNLSRDPNSLANLDQDLPNYAQNMIPIFSLPKEWLWCESWCSDKTKGKAKTIDLCNNPMHKEPKLDMAKRVISGGLFQESWTELDDEIRALERRLGVGVESSGGISSDQPSLDMGFG